jgi:meso-butanediol dehydrogenase/(S,S)-butanediol dehydrogenase/diacetyl reductase
MSGGSRTGRRRLVTLGQHVTDHAALAPMRPTPPAAAAAAAPSAAGGSPPSARGRLAGDVAVVTGAGSGIGAATALLFASEGASVVCVDVNASGLDSTASRIVAAGGTAPLTLAVDVSDEMAVKEIGPQAVARFGRVDILVNIAGIRDYSPVVDATEEQWDTLLAANLKGYAFACKHLLPLMEQTSGGNKAVVNISSVFGVEKVRSPSL